MVAALQTSYMNTVLICVRVPQVFLIRSMLMFHRNGVLDIRRLFLPLCNANEACFASSFDMYSVTVEFI